MTTPPTLTLFAHSLLSKWGFNDGDEPEHLLDYMDEVEINYNALPIDWHDALRSLVRKHLLPALAANGHQVEVYDIDTIHNPIRASKVDGVEIDDYARNDGVQLNPDSVTVSWADVACAWGVT